MQDLIVIFNLSLTIDTKYPSHSRYVPGDLTSCHPSLLVESRRAKCVDKDQPMLSCIVMPYPRPWNQQARANQNKTTASLCYKLPPSSQINCILPSHSFDNHSDVLYCTLFRYRWTTTFQVLRWCNTIPLPAPVPGQSSPPKFRQLKALISLSERVCVCVGKLLRSCDFHKFSALRAAMAIV
jgi:hypothetical protein